MIANVVHISLNARGGSERLSISTIRALFDMGYEVELSTNERTDLDKLEETCNQKIRNLIKKENNLFISPIRTNVENSTKYGVIVNTHGDLLPYFEKNFSKRNAITYCHFPLCHYYIQSKERDYLSLLRGLAIRLHFPDINYLKFAYEMYTKMMKNSTVLTNSEFSRQSIFKTFGVDSVVLNPPVDVDTFRNASLNSMDREDTVLVISRFHTSKKIENVVHLARMLKKRGVSSGVNIVGNLSPDQTGYYNYLNQLVRDYDLKDFVRFEVNLPFSRLLRLMGKSNIYFHPLPGEPFGISTVEAMSAGLIPVVPNIGGHTEFVPLQYQFNTFEEAVSIIENAIDSPFSMRAKLSHLTDRYSVKEYITKFQTIVARAVEDVESKQVMTTNPIQKKIASSTA